MAIWPATIGDGVMAFDIGTGASASRIGGFWLYPVELGAMDL